MLLALLFAQTIGHAAPNQPPQLPDALPYAKGFLVTGNYVVGGVDLTSQANPADSNGLATGTIPISGAPVGGAHIVAAYLYFEAVHPYPVTSDEVNPTIGIKFRNLPIPPGAVKVTTKSVSAGGATCWGAAGQGTFAVSMFRANVLSLLPKQYDADGKWTGKYIVNSADLPSNAQHTVTLREKTGDSAIQTAGATLLLVYRVIDPTEPLRKIVVYDGLYTAYNGVSSSTAEAEIMSQTIRGFYKSAGQSARISHLVGTGGNNQTERIKVTSAQGTITIGPPPNSNDPFPQTSPNSDRSWANPTYDLNAFMPGKTAPSDRYGEMVTTTVDATNTSPAACRAWAAVVFSTAVADVDDDGLPDGLEDASDGLMDPDDAELPNLNAMGASSRHVSGPKAGQPHPDLFLEFNSMWAAPGTAYGSAAAPYPNTSADCYDAATQRCVDAVGHHHIPTPADLKRIGDRFADQGITAHFDVGRVSGDPVLYPTAYHNLGVVQHGDWVDDYTSTEADQYLVGNGVGPNVVSLPRGGEVIRETACNPQDPECLFPDYPGTVGWKAGLLAHRNAPVNDGGGELNPDLTDPTSASFDWINSSQHRVRFDRERRPYFHYVLGAHTRGTPNVLPCVLPNGAPTGFGPGGTCGANAPNPAYQWPFVPSGSGGLADLPGRNILVTMGLWDEFVGRPYARAVTIFHELGHNLNLWHSGVPADFGDADEPTVSEANCKPNFMSSMSYLFQLHGLFDEFGAIQIDYSGGMLGALSENELSDGGRLATPSYQPAWYAPVYVLDANGDPVLDQNGQPMVSPLVSTLGASAAARFCSGARFAPGQPDTPMARVVSDSYDAQTGWHIDWNGDGLQDTVSQDANFDGVLDSSLAGYDDWSNIRLDQISANGLTAGSDDFVFLVGSDELTQLIGSDDFPHLIGSDELVMMIGSDELVMMIGSDDLTNLIGSDDLISLVGSDDLLSLIGSDDLTQLIGSDDLVSLLGSDQPELTFDAAKELGRVAPYELTACIVGTQNCTPAAAFTPEYHRVEVGWQASTVGHIDHYQVQRKRADAPDSAYEDVGSTTANALVDTDVLPKLSFTYRVRAHFDDPPAMSPWSVMPVTIEAVNELPQPQADSYVTALNTPITVPPPGVLGALHGNPGADKSSDNPAAYVARRAVLVTNVTSGTLVFNANGDGGFTFTPASGFVGNVTFTYKANDGFWSDDATVPMNGTDGLGNVVFSGPVSVTINVRKKK